VDRELAFGLFIKLGVNVQSMTKQEFTVAYYGLAKRYHPDRTGMRTAELMANINAARTWLLKFHTWEKVSHRN
jgi:DnaJ-class molecular chaperone